MIGKFTIVLLYAVVSLVGSDENKVPTDQVGSDVYPGADEYLLSALVPLLNPLNGLLFDGPASISNAPTTRNRNILPSLEQMKYYCNYAVSMYYGYGHDDLSCEYCQRYRNDVDAHETIHNDVHNTLALVTCSENRKEIVVAFRGTWNVWNVVLDALLIAGRNSNTPNDIKIHQGFYIATMSLYEDVVRTIAKYLNEHPEFKVVICGHSLGGAMARLTYFFLADNKQFKGVKYELYTYGEPRVGNRYFAEFMNKQPITTARIVYRADIASHFPPTSILGTTLLIGDYYVHAQTEYWMSGDETRFCCRTVREDPKCSMSLGPVYSIIDHLTYFDTNLVSILGQPLLFAHLPFGLLNPIKVLPPLPKPIENLIGGLAGGLVGALAAPLG